MLSTIQSKAGGAAAVVSSPWVFGGTVKDSASFDQSCDLCGRANVRITFKVRKAGSDSSRAVCEACLGKEQVVLKPMGRMMQGRDLRHHLGDIAVRVMLQTCRTVMRTLLTQHGDSELAEVAVYFDRNAQLSPRHAVTLFRVMSSKLPDIDPRIFEVQMRSVEHRGEFERLCEAEKLLVWPVLSLTARKRLIAVGQAPRRYAAPLNRRTTARQGQQVWTGATFTLADGAPG